MHAYKRVFIQCVCTCPCTCLFVFLCLPSGSPHTCTLLVGSDILHTLQSWRTCQLYGAPLLRPVHNDPPTHASCAQRPSYTCLLCTSTIPHMPSQCEHITSPCCAALHNCYDLAKFVGLHMSTHNRPRPAHVSTQHTTPTAQHSLPRRLRCGSTCLNIRFCTCLTYGPPALNIVPQSYSLPPA